MADFGYKAIDRAGKEVKGSIQADNEDMVARELRKQGLLPVSITPQTAMTKDISFNIGGKVKTRDLSVFCRQFVSMTRAGVTILEALKLLVEQTESRALRETLAAVMADVERGESLSYAMEQHPKVFPVLMINTVMAGEATGGLDTSMERMADHFEKANKTQAMVKKAMIYPILVVIVAIVVVAVILIMVIPQFSEMFKDMGVEMPAITKFVIACSDFIMTKWYILIPVIVAVVVGIKLFSATDTGKHVFGKLQLKLPLLGNLAVKSASAQLARTLSTMMASGVPLTEAIEITAKTMDNVWFKEALLETQKEVMRGTTLSAPLEQCGLFPPMVYHMVRIGEEAGATESMLDKLADYYDEEVEMATQSLMAAMEPIIIIVLAVIVMVIVGAVMMPMMSMYQGLDNL